MEEEEEEEEPRRRRSVTEVMYTGGMQWTSVTLCQLQLRRRQPGGSGMKILQKIWLLHMRSSVKVLEVHLGLLKTTRYQHDAL